MDRIFNAYKIKYDILTPQLIPIRASRRIYKINIFINIDDFIHKLHRPITDKEFQTTGKNASKQVVSNIINMAAHYKHWAVKEHLNPTVYLVYTDSVIFRNAMLIKEYRNYYNKISNISNQNFFFINKIMKDCFDILKIIAKYLPRIYCINSNYVEPSAVPLYLSEINNADFNLLISKDNYDLQYTHLDKWGVIVPKGDISQLIVNGNLWEYVRQKEKIQKEFYYHPETYVWAKAIIGDKYRSIPKLTRTSWKTVINYLEDFSSVGNNSVEILELQLKKLAEYITERKIKDTDFNHNLACTSVKQQLDSLLEVDKTMILQQLIDMEDFQALQQANQNIFREFPLNLQFLLQENPQIGTKPNDEYFWRKKGV